MYILTIEGRGRLIAMDVLDSEEAAEDYIIDCDGADLDEEYGSDLVGSGVIEELGDI